MSMYKLLHLLLSKEGEDFMCNLRTLQSMFKHIRTPLLAGILQTSKSLEESVRVIRRCESNSRQPKNKKFGGRPNSKYRYQRPRNGPNNARKENDKDSEQIEEQRENKDLRRNEDESLSMSEDG